MVGPEENVSTILSIFSISNSTSKNNENSPIPYENYSNKQFHCLFKETGGIQCMYKYFIRIKK